MTSVPPAELVREHLNRVLASPHFRTSKRSSHFLSFVVDLTLQGRQLEIKERTIGAAVFGRPLDYETPADPIVRVKANEVRKRLAQYYGEVGAEESVQIELPSGAYVPAFRWRGSASGIAVGMLTGDPPLLAEVRSVSDETVVSEQPGLARPKRSRRRSPALVAGGALLLVAAAFLGWKTIPRASPLDDFWAPVVRSSGAPLVCVGISDSWMISRRLQAELERLPAKGGSYGTVQVRPGEFPHLVNLHVSTGNFESVLALSLLLAAKGVSPQLRIGAAMSLQDVGQHPVISIGAFNNPWTIRRNAELRFAFEGDGADESAALSIKDRLHPETPWVVSDRFPWKAQTIDYAVITRLFDRTSGNVFITAAGINTFGTRAAGEFLTDPRYWEALVQSAPTGWQRKNLQIVLETSVVGTTPGPPRVLATYFW